MALSVTKFQSSFQVTLNAVLPYQGNTTSSLLQDSNYNQIVQTLTTLTQGTSTSQINYPILQVRLLAGGASETLNFFDGSIVDVFGGATGLQNLKYLAIYQMDNASGLTSATSATIGNAASNALQLNFGATTHTWTITQNGQPFLAGRYAGYTVNNTNKNILVTNNDVTNAFTYLLIAGGVKV